VQRAPAPAAVTQPGGGRVHRALQHRGGAIVAGTSRPIATGDVFLLYTDGLTEAMNPAGDFFGEDRLSALVQSHGTAPFSELRDEILSSISTFVGPAEQQDDMTMLLLRVQVSEAAAA